MKRLLVLAGAAVADVEDLPGSVREAIEAADQVFVVTPTLPTRLEWLVSDTDRARHEADSRLDTVLGHLRSEGIEAEGATGDETPETAIEDHVRAFQPDHLLVALRSPEHAAWQERGLLERTVAKFAIPTTVFEIDADGRVVGSSPEG